LEEKAFLVFSMGNDMNLLLWTSPMASVTRYAPSGSLSIPVGLLC